MTSIKRTAPKPLLSTARRPATSCGAAPSNKVSSCGGWVSKGTRAPAEKKETQTGGWSAPRKASASVSSCGGNWSRNGKLPSGC